MSAAMTAMTIASENEITVSGMVIVRPGSRIFGNESIKIPISLSFIRFSPRALLYDKKPIMSSRSFK